MNYSIGQCCEDCRILIAYGETPPFMTEAESAAYVEAFEHKTAGTRVSLGLYRDDHDEGCIYLSEDGDTGDTCECEDHGFRMSSCDTCGSVLGGYRYAVTFDFMVKPGLTTDQTAGTQES